MTSDGRPEVLDLEGRTLIRGFWDEHVHVTQAALARVTVPLRGAASAAEALARVVTAPAIGDLVVGMGFQDGTWPDAPTQETIDAAAGERPVVLVSHDVHAVWLSSAAARRFGVVSDSDGVLREGPAFAVGQQINAALAAHADEAVRALLADALGRGVVGVVDLEMTWNPGVWLDRMSVGWAGPRIEAGVYPVDLDRAVAAGLRTGAPVDAAAPLLTVGPLKALMDGALNTRTAFCADPYPDGGHGRLELSEADLVPLLRRARETGFVPAIHAIGDAAISIALDGFAAAGVGGRVEHAQLVADADLPRFGALGVTASVQPAHLLDDREVAAVHWPGRTDRAYSFRALLDAGATLAFGSDAPVAPLDPWRALRAAVDRALPGEEAWHPEQRITLEEALAASTRGRPTPIAGEAADLVALDAPVEHLDPASIAATVVAGRVVHRTF